MEKMTRTSLTHIFTIAVLTLGMGFATVSHAYNEGEGPDSGADTRSGSPEDRDNGGDGPENTDADNTAENTAEAKAEAAAAAAETLSELDKEEIVDLASQPGTEVAEALGTIGFAMTKDGKIQLDRSGRAVPPSEDTMQSYASYLDSDTFQALKDNIDNFNQMLADEARKGVADGSLVSKGKTKDAKTGAFERDVSLLGGLGKLFGGTPEDPSKIYEMDTFGRSNGDNDPVVVKKPTEDEILSAKMQGILDAANGTVDKKRYKKDIYYRDGVDRYMDAESDEEREKLVETAEQYKAERALLKNKPSKNNNFGG